MQKAVLLWLIGAGLTFAPAAAGYAQIQVLGPGGVAQAPSEPQPDCGSQEFTIAQMAWPSASILAHIHDQLLSEHFACSTRVIGGDPSATISSMTTTGQPAAAPELWVSRVAELWNGALRSQSVRAAGPVFSGGDLEAWFVPSYVRENHPGLQSVADLADYWQVFAPEAASRGVLVSCPIDWACALINRNLLAGHGLSEHFEITEPADRFTLDRMVADAVTQREPVLVYYWQPNGLIERFDLVPLDMGPFDLGNAQCMALEQCVPFGPSSFAPDTVVIGLAEWVYSQAPLVAAYFARAVMPLDEMNALLDWQADADASAEATARHFIDTREAIWSGWIDD